MHDLRRVAAPLYLIFQHLLGLLLLMGHTSSAKDIELLVQAGTAHHDGNLGAVAP